MLPVADQLPAVGEQRVIRMHDAFRLACRARREGEIDDLVRVIDGITLRRTCSGKVIGRVDGLQRRHGREHVVEGAAGTISAPSWLGEEGSRREAVQQRADFAAGMGAMEARIARDALARTGEQKDDRLDAVGQPQADAVAADKSAAAEIGRDAVHPRSQLSPAQCAASVAQGRRIRPGSLVSHDELVESLPTPEPFGIVSSRLAGMMQCEERPHHQCPNLLASGLRFCVIEVDNSWCSSVSR